MTTTKKALITGVTGQDGSFLADLLLSEGYEVYGLVRRSSTNNQYRIKKALENGLVLVNGDVTESLGHIFRDYGPFDECYNLAAQSHVRLSWDQPVSTFQINAQGCINLLETIRLYNPECRFLQASSSELFGDNPPPQNEKTIIKPRSPYAVSKAAAHYATINYRESYGLHACCAISFNHESSRRGDEFVTQKIVKAARKIAFGEQEFIELGNLSAKRDWSHAKDIVYGMWLMLQGNSSPKEYVMSSGEMYSVDEFLRRVFIDKYDLSYYKHVRINKELFRPAEVPALCGDSSLIREELGWSPKYNFDKLIQAMINGEEDD